MVQRFPKQRRSGTILPLLAVSMIGLAGFCGLAIDLGLLAVARTQAQNAADTSALTACRLLNGKSANSNLVAAYAESRIQVKTNFNLNTKYTDAQIKAIEVGQYLYNPDPLVQSFAVYNGAGALGWKDASTNPQPNSGQWTAIRVTLSTNQPTYFMRVFGVNSMPTGAKATAVYRPRDVAFVLDMTGSMANSCLFNSSGASMNPDTNVPVFAHYNAQSMASNTGNGSGSTGMIATGSLYASGSGVLSPSNYTMNTNGGPPLVDGFYWDPGNLGSMTTPSTLSGPPPLNAFKRWNPPPDYSGYDATHKGNEGSPKGPVPAPPSFASMTDAGALKYVGDRYRRADGSINKMDANWTGNSSDTSIRGAINALELLGYGYSGGNVLKSSGGGSIVSALQFRDPIWEENGYDLDIKQYRTDRAGGNPKPPNSSAYRAPLQALAADKFKGYSMGPGYYGKTFFIWPPDPRWGSDARTDLPGNAPYGNGSPDPNNPAASGVKDTSGNWICDWRQRFFYSTISANQPFNTQGDNKAGGSTEGINETLLNSGTSGYTLIPGSTSYKINYTAVLKWIKSGPLVLPPNLRAGRIVYYTSIPDTVDFSSNATDDVNMDKAFWKRYIDFVLGYNRTSSNNYTELYGNSDTWTGNGTTWGSSNINTSDMTAWTGPTATWPSRRPYMAYNDNPRRPRLHFWFGPLSMVDFLIDGNVGSNSTPANWNPGTCTESQCWQLKAGMNSVIDDVKNNHPNHYIGLTMFSGNANDIRSPLGGGTQVLIPGGAQHSVELKNALFYPKSLLTKISTGDVTTEVRPFKNTGSNTSAAFPSVDDDEIPNAKSSTDPMTGLAYAFNLLSPSAPLASSYPQYGSATNMGRRGAAKVVIFETDGVPNAIRSGGGYQQLGYDSYYKHYTGGPSGTSGYTGAANPALAIIDKMQVTIATDLTSNSGMSLPNAPCRVYPIAFGDLFDNDIVASPPLTTTVYNNAKTLQTDALQFLSDVASHGKTGSSGAAIPSTQIITGPYASRIDTLKTCMENIFQSGVAVTLVE
ncbi:MAG: Tad domain-containing protein [Planctomycetes bacterium]|nr:Tad domain-containing protein [Planctomycetota bacterium]